MSVPGRKMKLLYWIPCFLIGIVVFFIIYALMQGLTGFAGRAGNGAAAAVAVLCGIGTLGLYALWHKAWDGLSGCRKENDIPLSRCLPETGKGLLTGVIYFALVVGVIALAGCYRVKDVGFHFMPQLRFFALFFLVAVLEEVIFRGIIFRMIDEQFNTVAAYIVSALVFGAAHLANPGATWWAGLAIAIEAGVMLSAAYKYSGTLWMPIGIHWAWNYTQGNILGFAVSGGNARESVLVPEISGPDIITGGPFGAEASVVAVVIGSLLSALLIIAWLRRPR